MAISRPRESLLVLSAFGATTERISERFELHPAATQVSFFAVFTQAGTLDIDYIDLDGDAHQIATTAVVANTATVVTLNYNPGAVRARFTASSSPVSGAIEATYAGHGGGLS